MLAFTIAALAASATPTEVLQNVFAAFNRHDAAAVASFYAKDAILISPDFCGQKVGPAAVRANYAKYFETFPDANDRIVSLVQDGNAVAAEFVFTGTMDGRKIEIPLASFVRVKNGKIVRDVTYFDANPTPNCSSP